MVVVLQYSTQLGPWWKHAKEIICIKLAFTINSGGAMSFWMTFLLSRYVPHDYIAKLKFTALCISVPKVPTFSSERNLRHVIYGYMRCSADMDRTVKQ